MILPEWPHVADRGDRVGRFPPELEVNDQILHPGHASACGYIWIVGEVPRGYASVVEPRSTEASQSLPNRRPADSMTSSWERAISDFAVRRRSTNANSLHAVGRG